MREDDHEVAAARAGDEAAFARLAERYRPELRAHCYRMLGSYDESQDLVQETLLRAWRGRSSFRGDASFRAWLYRIATNACLDFLARTPRPAIVTDPEPSPVSVPWLQPYPDHLLPDASIVAKETIELAFVAAVQYLTPVQRAVLIMRDVLGWPAKETAGQLDITVAAVNSGLQRARRNLRTRLPERRLDWPAAEPTAEERAAVERFMAALESADDKAIAAALREDARVGHQPGAGGHVGAVPAVYAGRETIVAAWAPILHGPDARDLRFIPIRANRQPALATYTRIPGTTTYAAFTLNVLQVHAGAIAEIMTFGPDLFPAFDVPSAL